MRYLNVLALLAGILFTATPATPVASASPLAAKIKFLCHTTNIKQEDPLTNPGPPGTLSDHNHWEACGEDWGADTNPGRLLSGGTSAFLPGQHSAYWGPTFVASDGTTVPASSFSAYYAAGGVDTRAIAGGQLQSFPLGLSILAGDPRSTMLQSTSRVRWRCAQGVATYGSPPAHCAGSMQLEIDFPQCWDGRQLDTPDHKSHVTYRVTVTLGDGTVVKGCPVSHPVALPQIQAQASYPRPVVGWQGAFLSSDHGIGPDGRTAHMDVMQAEDATDSALWLSCLNDTSRSDVNDPTCGVFTFDTNNAWTVAMEQWRDLFPLYVTPTGSAWKP